MRDKARNRPRRRRRKHTLEISVSNVGNFRFQRRKFKALGTGDILLALTRDHETNLASGATARPTRTSRILPDVILTLVHSTRLLPEVVKIMSVPRSVSRATVSPSARHRLKAHWNRLKGREIAGPAIDGRCTKKQRLAAEASGHDYVLRQGGKSKIFFWK